jgi:hypothetical protein
MDGIAKWVVYGGAALLGTLVKGGVGVGLGLAGYAVSERLEAEEEHAKEERGRLLRVMSEVQREYAAILIYFADVYQKKCLKETIGKYPERKAKLLKHINEKSANPRFMP